MEYRTSVCILRKATRPSSETPGRNQHRSPSSCPGVTMSALMGSGVAGFSGAIVKNVVVRCGSLDLALASQGNVVAHGSTLLLNCLGDRSLSAPHDHFDGFQPFYEVLDFAQVLETPEGHRQIPRSIWGSLDLEPGTKLQQLQPPLGPRGQRRGGYAPGPESTILREDTPCLRQLLPAQGRHGSQGTFGSGPRPRRSRRSQSDQLSPNPATMESPPHGRCSHTFVGTLPRCHERSH